jgi:hypothetical protein
MLFLSIMCGIINLLMNIFTSVGFEIKNDMTSNMTRGTRQWILIAQHISKMGVEQVPWLIAAYKTHCKKTK